MLILFSLLLNICFSQTGRPLEVYNVQYVDAIDQPSCALLKHRSFERQKVIRELRHLMEIDNDDPIGKIMAEDQLISNKLFLDESLWEAPTTKVTFTSKTTSEMQENMTHHGLNNLILRIKGKGLTWTSHPDQFPEEIQFQFHSETNEFSVTYWIYLNSYCLKGMDQPQFFWFGPNDDFQDIDNSKYIYEELIQAFKD